MRVKDTIPRPERNLTVTGSNARGLQDFKRAPAQLPTAPRAATALRGKDWDLLYGPRQDAEHVPVAGWAKHWMRRAAAPALRRAGQAPTRRHRHHSVERASGRARLNPQHLASACRRQAHQGVGHGHMHRVPPITRARELRIRDHIGNTKIKQKLPG